MVEGSEYMRRFQHLAGQFELEHHDGVFPGLHLWEGASFESQPEWQPGRHYVLLTDASGAQSLGWAWFQEEPEWWLLQHVWVAQRARRQGHASHMLRYIESACQFSAGPLARPSELRLTALDGAGGFYDRTGFHVLGGVVYAKELVAGSAPEFEAAHAASRVCRRGPEEDGRGIAALSFRLHILAAPVSAA